MATGAYIRLERDGKFVPVEIDQLTDEELETLERNCPEHGWLWAKFLAAWIRDHVIEEESNHDSKQ